MQREYMGLFVMIGMEKMWMANYLLFLIHVGDFISVLSGVNVHEHTPHEHGLHSELTGNQEILNGKEQ